MLRKPDDLRDLCHLPSVPELTETTKAALLPIGDRESDKLHMFQTADVNYEQWSELRGLTKGHMVCLWFQGERRWAWLAQSLKVEDKGEIEAANDSDG